MIDLNEFAKEVHANAVAHGWYDKGERTEAEIFANIHSEWSEAFDAYAHGLPWYYHNCGDPATKGEICENLEECYSRKIGSDGDHCFMRNKKPEGIAVELIDGVIRILDYVGYMASKGERLYIDNPFVDGLESFCELICFLHDLTHDARCYYCDRDGLFTEIITHIFEFIKKQGLDPEAIMIEKHEYNKTRPYRHGGKVV